MPNQRLSQTGSRRKQSPEFKALSNKIMRVFERELDGLCLDNPPERRRAARVIARRILQDELFPRMTTTGNRRP